MSLCRMREGKVGQVVKVSHWIVGTLLLLSTVLTSCAVKGERADPAAARQRQGVVVCNLASEPSSLDPARATRLADLRVIGQCLEGLVRVGADGQLQPAAAESWQISPDQRTYRFRLREARWSNGDAVRSSDFAFAWRRVLDPATRAYWASLLFGIRGAPQYYRASPQERTSTSLGVETPDDRTLVVHLERPVPYFLSLAALEAYYPAHPATVTRLGERAFRASEYVSNGPFRITEHVPRRRIVLEPNPYYHGRDRVALRRLVFVMVENEFTEWTAYRRGEIDVTNGLHRSALATARGQPDFRTAPLVGTCYLAFNCSRPPFDRVEVRRAFAHALDRRLLVERITRGGERAATGLVPPGVAAPAAPKPDRAKAGRTESSDFRQEGGDLLSPDSPNAGDLERARSAAASLDIAIVYSFDASESQRSLAIALQMMWQQTLGAKVEIQSYPARLLAQSKHDGDFMMARASWVADYLDATSFLDVFRANSPNNSTRWANPHYDALLDRAEVTTDAAARADLLHRAEALLIDEMPICPLYFYSIAYLQRPGLEGVGRNLLGRLDFSRAAWDRTDPIAPKD